MCCCITGRQKKHNCGLRNKILLQAWLCCPRGPTEVMSKASETHKGYLNKEDLKINLLITGLQKISQNKYKYG